VDLVGGDAPERKTIVLALEKLVQRLRILGRAASLPRACAQREALVVIRDAPRAAPALEADLAGLERLVVMPAEYRQEQLPSAARPIDIEELRVARSAALREHVFPPGTACMQHR